jgi:hypothetical protein
MQTETAIAVPVSPRPISAKKAPLVACLECGEAFELKAEYQEFCSTACRKAFNNRRAVRGAEMYDLFMTLRYERTLAAKLKVWSLLCRMALGFREEDEKFRKGRRSWQPIARVLEKKPYLKVEVLSRNNAGARR